MSFQRPFIQVVIGIGLGLATLFTLGAISQTTWLSAVAQQIPKQASHPVIVVDQTDCHFGEVQSGRTYEATFEIRNVGLSRLILRKTGNDPLGWRKVNNRSAVI